MKVSITRILWNVRIFLFFDLLKVHQWAENRRLVVMLFDEMDGDLFSFIDQIPLLPGHAVPFVPEKQAIPIMKQILKGVEYLHAHDILHRDLKVDNILYKKNNDGFVRIAIADFGYSVRTKTSVCGALGTPVYAAPELWTNPYGTSVDMWAVGIICFCTLIGRFPFYSDDDKVLLNQIFHDPINWKGREDISHNAMDLVETLLQKDPANRINAKDALNHPWFEG